MKRILIVTDCIDVAANELHATLVSTLDKLGAKDVQVEPIVAVDNFSVLQASFVSRLLAESYDPKSLTILSVVNPLDTSDTKRARIAGRLKNGLQFVGANTGVFTWLINDFGLDELCETDMTGLKGDTFISFGGKYIHAPITAKLAVSGNLEDVKAGDFSVKDLRNLTFKQGTVLHIDNFGVAKLYHRDNDLQAEKGDVFTLSVNGKKVSEATYCHSMKELADGQLALYKGSSMSMLEVGTVRHTDTAVTLGISIGDVIDIRPAAKSSR